MSRFMSQKRRRILMSAVLVSTLGVTSGALADHDDQKNPPLSTHVPIPTNKPIINHPKAECTVRGTVHIDDQFVTGGISATQHNHNHYHFKDISVDCVDVPGDQDYGGSYDVYADGGTDGCLPTAMSSKDLNNCTSLKLEGKVPGHGEWTGMGWSHGSGYNDDSINLENAGDAELDKPWGTPGTCNPKKLDNQKGDIHVERPAGDNDGAATNKWADGWVKFTREGTVVEVWGCLDWKEDNIKKQDFFLGLLKFVAAPAPKIRDATLVGAVTIGN